MFAPSRLMSAKLQQEFTTPVESVMKCEDFKSNFARKFSDRFISRSPVLTTKDETLELTTDNAKNEDNSLQHIPEMFERNSQVLRNNSLEQNGISLKVLEKSFILNDIRKTEENALNMEVETLRWQLAQTEANRQMHIELLRQIVSFLNKVKDHIGKSNELKHKHNKEGPPSTLMSRSRSVLHVNTNEYPSKATNSRKISKSISNVKDCAWLWCRKPTLEPEEAKWLRKDKHNRNVSKLSLICDADMSKKIKEEMTRLIRLADTVLNTKLPALACTCNDNRLDNNKANNNIQMPNVLLDENKSLTIKNNLKETSEFGNTINNKNTEVKENNLSNFLTSSLNLALDAEDPSIDMKLNEKKLKNVSNSLEKLHKSDNSNDFVSTSFIEDESGFSSMNSFQEIGIPIISIIPPSPCKNLPYIDHCPDVLAESKQWKTALDLNDQNVKVFWV